MSEKTSNAYSSFGILERNNGATAAAVEMLTSACSAGDESSKLQILNWAIEGDNLKSLRDKIKEAASG